MLESKQLCPLDLFPAVHTRYVEPNEFAPFPGGELSFLNVNTAADLALARRLSGRRRREEPSGRIECPPYQKYGRVTASV